MFCRMLRILAALSVLLPLVLSQCDVDSKILAIWYDMDIFPNDAKVTPTEMQVFFSNMSDPITGIVFYGAFHSFWSQRYCGETSQVTDYFFKQWDLFPQNIPDGYLTLDDLVLAFNTIDTDDPDSVGFIDLFTEWHPYFTKLYSEALAQA
ncbi:uncharacterized protein LOC123549277 isoform X1 [Mercenaria mercenaria]|uniref:uncharacterized protein LOC123549277 isoform X1 n=2 Tax=Mercenaria mercenaria TaxID=6596 RepID=UPI00234F6667|nr:uncharacterized protein LOC123549277 isoform X1 [Mercenaria mercenaria]